MVGRQNYALANKVPYTIRNTLPIELPAIPKVGLPRFAKSTRNYPRLGYPQHICIPGAVRCCFGIRWRCGRGKGAGAEAIRVSLQAGVGRRGTLSVEGVILVSGLAQQLDVVSRDFVGVIVAEMGAHVFDYGGYLCVVEKAAEARRRLFVRKARDKSGTRRSIASSCRRAQDKNPRRLRPSHPACGNPGRSRRKGPGRPYAERNSAPRCPPNPERDAAPDQGDRECVADKQCSHHAQLLPNMPARYPAQPPATTRLCSRSIALRDDRMAPSCQALTYEQCSPARTVRRSIAQRFL